MLFSLFRGRSRDIITIVNPPANRHIQRIGSILEGFFKGIALSNNFRNITASDNIAAIVFIFSYQY